MFLFFRGVIVVSGQMFASVTVHKVDNGDESELASSQSLSNQIGVDAAVSASVDNTLACGVSVCCFTTLDSSFRSTLAYGIVC
jgi:hypothetical protein